MVGRPTRYALGGAGGSGDGASYSPGMEAVSAAKRGHDCGDDNCGYWKRALALRDIRAGHNTVLFIGAVEGVFFGLAISRLYVGFIRPGRGLAFGVWWA